MTNCMQFYVVGGNKGGITKTGTSLFIADYCIRRGDNVLLLDSEQDTFQATASAIAAASGMVPFSVESPAYPAYAVWPLGTLTGWDDAVSALAELGFDTPIQVIADTGASQLGAMIDSLDVIGGAVEAGLNVTLLCLCGRLEDSTLAVDALLEGVRGLPPVQRPRVWVLLVDPDGAPEASFDIARPFQNSGETEALSILDRAVRADPEHVHAQYVGRWPDSLFNAAMVLRRLPGMALEDKSMPFGMRLRLKSVMARQTDPLFAEIAPAVATAAEPEKAAGGKKDKKGNDAPVAGEGGADAR